MANLLQKRISSITKQMAEDYEEVRQEASNKMSNTAGGKGETHWKKILEHWLPKKYLIETNVRVIGDNGELSGEMDLVILPSWYPDGLVEKKHIFHKCVLAAFECKNTLEKKHIEKFFVNAKRLSELSDKPLGTPYRESCCPIYYGLLAHSHNWKPENATAKIEELLKDELEKTSSPRDVPHLVCVSNLNTFQATRSCHYPYKPRHGLIDERMLEVNNKLDQEDIKHLGAVRGISVCWSKMDRQQNEDTDPIGLMLVDLLWHLARHDNEIRSLALTFNEYLPVSTSGEGKGFSSIQLSREVRERIEKGEPDFFENQGPWDEWKAILFSKF